MCYSYSQDLGPSICLLFVGDPDERRKKLADGASRSPGRFVNEITKTTLLACLEYCALSYVPVKRRRDLCHIKAPSRTRSVLGPYMT